MSSPKPTGPLSKVEMAYIVDHFKKESVTEIAEFLNRTEETVKKYLLQVGLYKEKTEDELEEEGRLKNDLYSLAYWPSIISSYEDDDIEYFENNWISIMKQLNEDASYTEKIYIKDWVQLEIEKKHLLSNQKETRVAIRELNEKLKGAEKELEIDPTDMAANQLASRLRTELGFMRGAEGQHISQLQKVNGDIKNISSKLKTDREDRRTVITNAETWWGYCGLLRDERFRLDESYKAEIGRLSQKKAKENLMELHKFKDDTHDYCILSAETMEREDAKDE